MVKNGLVFASKLQQRKKQTGEQEFLFSMGIKVMSLAGSFLIA